MSWQLGLYVRERAPAPDRTRLAAAFGVEDDAGSAPDTMEIGRPETGATCQLLPAEVSPQEATATPVSARARGYALTTWRLSVPLVRSPTLARDLLPSCAAAAASLDAVFAPLALAEQDAAAFFGDAAGAALVDAWDAAHAVALRELRGHCDETGAPPPPFLPRASLVALHAWLLALARESALDPRVPPFAHGLDPRDGGPTRIAVPMPLTTDAIRLPPLPCLIVDTGAGPRVIEAACLDAFGDVDDVGLRWVALNDAVWAAIGAAPSMPMQRYRIVSAVEIVDEEALFER